MNAPRFFCQPLTQGDVTLSSEESRHACRVLRLAVGDPVRLFDGDGGLADGHVSQTTHKTCVVTVGQVCRRSPPNPRTLTLVTALPRVHRQQFLFEKCTELGVTQIVPTAFARSTVKPKPSAVAKWKQWTIEAGKQSGSTHLPQIAPPSGFRETLSRCDGISLSIFGAVDSQAIPLGDLILPQVGTKSAKTKSARASSVVAWIGPEGGLTDEETAHLRSAGAHPISLGTNVLRIETAAIALSAFIALSSQAPREEKGFKPVSG